MTRPSPSPTAAAASAARRERELNGYSVVVAAREVGVSEQHLRRVEKSGRVPYILALRLARLYGCPVGRVMINTTSDSHDHRSTEGTAGRNESTGSGEGTTGRNQRRSPAALLDIRTRAEKEAGIR